MRSSRSAYSRRSFMKHTIAVAATVPMLSQMAMAANRSVHVFNWDTYIGPNTLEEFTKATGVEVKYDLFADNSELFARLRNGNPGYDVICPSNDFVERMIKADMLTPIDHAKIPNFKNYDPRFQDASFDPGRKFSLTYFWGTIGVGYRTSKFKDAAPNSWAQLMGPESAAHKGKISWMSDPVRVINHALKLNGASLNTTDAAEIEKAVQLLLANKANVRTLAGDNGQDLILSNEVDLAMEYNGDMLQVKAEDDDINYVVPKEGAELWQDCWAIPKGGPDVEAAHEFINYILSAQVHADIAKEVNYALPNAEAIKLMPEEYQKNSIIFPAEEVLKACETPRYLGEEIAKMKADGMTRVRAG